MWASCGSRVLTLAVLYRSRSLARSLSGEPPVPSQNRADRQYSIAQRRIIGRRGKWLSKGYLGALGRVSGIALGLALAAQQELVGVPIEDAVKIVNKAFGWRYE